MPPPAKRGRMRLAATLCATLLLFAGCLSKDDPVEPAATADPGEPASEADPAAAPPVAPPPADPEPSAGAPASGPDPMPSSVAAPPPRIEVVGWNLTFTGAGASPPAGPACCVWRTAQGETSMAFELPEGAKALVVELAWSDAAIDLDLQLLGADYAETVPPEPNGAETAFHAGHMWSATQGAPGSPDSHTVILVTEVEALVAGSWGWRVGAEGPAKDLAFSVHASIFLDAAPPEGYSAVTPSGNP